MEIVSVDVGNSRVGAAWVSRGQVIWMGSTAGYGHRAVQRLLREVRREGFNGKEPDAVAICSVVPAQTPRVEESVAKVFPGILQIRTGWGAEMGIATNLAAPERTGADRFADVVAAGALYHRAAVIVCDFGTASTFNLLLPEKGFCGGAIAPGYGMWVDALTRRTAQLPPLTETEKGNPGIGRDPEGALRAGRAWGFRGMVTEIIWQLTKECGRRNPVVLATGGWAAFVAAGAGFAIDVVPELTLAGAALIAERTLRKQKTGVAK